MIYTNYQNIRKVYSWKCSVFNTLQRNFPGFVDAARYEHQPPVGHIFQQIFLWQLNAIVTGLLRLGSVGDHIRDGTTAPLTRARR
jgi:hypothetical protein